jgi:hypothetical protein
VALEKMQDETVNSASIAFTPELRDRLHELRRLAKFASERRGIIRDYPGEVKRVKIPDDVEGRRLRSKALEELREHIVAFIEDGETPNH